MQRVIQATVVAGLVVAAAVTIAGSSHREAPGITKTPKLDGTDFYMFRSFEPGRDANVTFLANYQGLQDTYGGPNFFNMDENAAYEIHVDNNGDGIEDLTFQFQFQRIQKNLAVNVDGVMTPVPLVNIGGIGVAGDPNDTANANVQETYTLNLVRGPRRSGQRLPIMGSGGATFKKPVDRIGDKSIRNNDPGVYDQYADNHIYGVTIPGCSAPGRVFVGQRREGFVVNLAEVFDLINLNPLGPENAEKNTLADKNVSTLALEVPIACLVAGGDPVIGAWTTASAGKGTPASGGGFEPCPAGSPSSPPPAAPPGITIVPTKDCKGYVPSNHPQARGNSGGTGSGGGVDGAPGQFTQVSRLGHPLVNELVIGLPDKDKFNASEPKDDTQFLNYVTNPSLPVLVEALFGVRHPPSPRNDLVAVFLTGVTGLNRPKNVSPAEVLRLNTSIAPTPEASQHRLGVLGNDLAGFPNGRRPGDDVVDIVLRVAEGILLSPTPAAFPALTDGAYSDASVAYTPDGSLTTDPAFRLYRNSFPYLRLPLSGSPDPIHH